MSNKRWDLVLSSTGKGDRKNYTKVGAMFQNEKGGFTLYIDKGVSVSTPEGVYLNAYEPKPREQQSGAGFGGGASRGNAQPSQQKGGVYDENPFEDDSSLPF